MWTRRAFLPLFLALLLSLLVHLALIGRLSIWFDWEEAARVPIEVNLARLPPPAPMPQPVSQPAIKKPAAPVKPKPVITPPAPPMKSEPTPIPEPGVEPPPLREVVTEPIPVAEEIPPVALPQAAEEIDPAPHPEEMPEIVLPRHIEIDYRILRKGAAAGTEHHDYQVGGDGRYRLRSIAEPKGLLALALSDLVQQSEGTVTAQGLRPDTFLYQYGKNPDKAQKATFDWTAGKLVLEVGSRRQTVPLTDGAQDLMSFMYQFMFVPPLQEMQLAITNGKRLKTYAYGFEGEKTLETRMGRLRCLHIARSSDDGEEKTELWLAADYHYLPVKISKTEKDGTVTERIASRLQLE